MFVLNCSHAFCVYVHPFTGILLQLLEQVSRTPTQKDRDNIENLEVEEKNRYPNKFPCECVVCVVETECSVTIYSLRTDEAHRPVLNGSTKREQYINASFIDVSG